MIGSSHQRAPGRQDQRPLDWLENRRCHGVEADLPERPEERT